MSEKGVVALSLFSGIGGFEVGMQGVVFPLLGHWNGIKNVVKH